MKNSIKEFGNARVDAVLSELQQLHDCKVLEPRPADELTREEKRSALHYLLAGSRGSTLIKKMPVLPPFLLSNQLCFCASWIPLNVATWQLVDIPGAFKQADMDELVHMRLDGKMVELLVRVDPELYQKYVVNKNGKPVLYVVLKKSPVRNTHGGLLFWFTIGCRSSLLPSSGTRSKLVHNWLNLGTQRAKLHPLSPEMANQCPYCQLEEETFTHMMTCPDPHAKKCRFEAS
jgi:hypothetical protein